MAVNVPGSANSGRRYKEDLGSLPVNVRVHPQAGNFLYLVRKKVEHVLVGVWLDTQVIPGPVTIGHRSCNPVYIETQKICQFPPEYGNFGRINPVRTKH